MQSAAKEIAKKPEHAWLERVKIRQLNEDDLQSLEWDGQFTHYRRLYREIWRSASHGKAVMWGVELEGEGILGQLFVQLDSSRPELADGIQRAYIYGVRVKPDYQRHGLGTLLMKYAEKDLKQRGFLSVTLNVSKENSLARKLYERLGYRITADEPGIWNYRDEEGILHEVCDPSWRMEKSLNDILSEVNGW